MKQVEFREPRCIGSDAEAWIQIAQGRESTVIICPYCSFLINTEILCSPNIHAKDAAVSRHVQGFLLMAFVTIVTCGILGYLTGLVWVCISVGLVLLVLDMIITAKLCSEARTIYQYVTHYCPNCKEKLGVSDGLSVNTKHSGGLLD